MASSDLLLRIQTSRNLPRLAAPQQRSRLFSRQNLLTLSPTTSIPHNTSLSLKCCSINRSKPFAVSPSFATPGRRSLVAAVIRPDFNVPLISSQDQWGTWTALFSTAAFGIWSERTKIGSQLSGSLVSILVGLAASNLGIIATGGPAYSAVLGFLLPIAVPLLLFRADLKSVINSTGRLFLAFLLGSVATTVGTVVAYLLVPMQSLGEDSWKIAAALMGRHIGGAVNYVAIADALGVSPSVLTAGIAADTVVCTVYFSTLFALASKVPPEASTPVNDDELNTASKPGNKLPVLQMATALAVALAICKAGTFLTEYFGIPGGNLPAVTAIVVILATAFPKPFASLAPTGEAMALILMHVFFAVIGASGSIWSVINTTPSIFVFAFVQIAVHLAVILGLGRLFGFDLKLLLIASNANVGGPTTACAMATAKEWSSLIIPGILAGIFGISIATFLGIGFGVTVLKGM